MNYVIIGGGAASVGCIEGIRRQDRAGEITLICGEPFLPYCRPLISYYLEGKTDLNKMEYRNAEFYRENRVTVLSGLTVTAVTPAKKELLLSDGKTLSYDKLLCATGSTPFVPPFEGLDTVPNAFSFLTLSDTLALEKELSETARVLIVGAGLIGLKCAEGIRARVGSITVCDLAPRVLPSILDDTCAAFVQKKLEEHGISFLLADSVSSFSGNRAYMKSGKELEFDLLVLAVGVRPNSTLLKAAGAETARGTVTDSSMRTSLPDIYAAGDCAESMDLSCGERRVLALWPNAVLCGECAGASMAGAEAAFQKATPMNSIGFFSLHIATAGSYTGTLYEEKTESSLKRLFYENDRLHGFILIGDVARAGIYTALIREQVPLSSVDFELLKKETSLAAFSRAWRAENLGGTV